MATDTPYKDEVPIFPDLTDRQSKTLTYMALHWAEFGYLPTHRKICAFLEVKSTNATPYVTALVSKGYITRSLVGAKTKLKLTHAGIRKLQMMGEPFVIDEEGNVSYAKKKGTNKRKKQ